jgi:hypothetical protein
MLTFFKSIDGSSLDDSTSKKCTTVKIGDAISTTIPKSLTKCKPKVAVVKCGEKTINCLPVADIDRTILYGCVYEIDNDNKAFANIVIKNKSLVPKFILGFSETDDENATENAELFEFEGGTFDELVSYLESNGNFGFELTSYGIKIYVGKEYAGKKIYLSSDKTIFLLGTTYCLNRNYEYGLSYCLPTVGCYQILLYTIVNGVETVLATR